MRASGAVQNAARWGNEDCLTVLVEARADVNENSGKGEGKSAVGLAQEKGHEECMEFLREYGGV